MTNIAIIEKDINLSKEVFYKEWLIVLDVCGKQPLKETSMFYYKELNHLTNEQYVNAIKTTLRSKKYPSLPMLGEILDNVTTELKTLSDGDVVTPETFKEINDDRFEFDSNSWRVILVK